MIGNKIADKITYIGKTKSKKTEEERQEIYILPEKRQQIIGDLRCFKRDYIKIGIPKNHTNLLGRTLDEVPRFITGKWVEVRDQSGSADDRYKLSKQIRFKKSMLRSDLCDYSDVYIVEKGEVTVTEGSNSS